MMYSAARVKEPTTPAVGHPSFLKEGNRRGAGIKFTMLHRLSSFWKEEYPEGEVVGIKAVL